MGMIVPVESKNVLESVSERYIVSYPFMGMLRYLIVFVQETE